MNKRIAKILVSAWLSMGLIACGDFQIETVTGAFKKGGIARSAAGAISFSDIQKTGFFQMADARAGGYTYGYAPSIMYSQGEYHAYYCSNGTGFSDWDNVRHVASADGIHWGAVTTVLHASGLDRAACDPSVVTFDAGDGNYFYMMYSGNVDGVQTANFIARSPRPGGEFLKYTDRGTWEKDPKDPRAIIWPFVSSPDNSGIYGAGEPSLVVVGRLVYQFYVDTSWSGSANTSRTFVRYSGDMINWSDATATNVMSGSVDVKYDDVHKVFLMTEILMPHTNQSVLSLRTSTDGITWTGPQVICDANCFPRQAHNVGMSGDEAGHISNDGKVLVGFGAPYGLNTSFNLDCAIAPGNCFGDWDLYGMTLTLPDFSTQSNSATQTSTATTTTTAANHEVVGLIDGVSNDVLSGWACVRGVEAFISIRVYVDGPAGTGTPVGEWNASHWSEPTVAQYCGNSGDNYRFAIPIGDYKSLYGGRRIYVHGMSNVRGANSLLTQSGSFIMPSQDSLAGIYRFYNARNGEHFYTSSYDEGIGAGFIPERLAFHVLSSGGANRHLIYRCNQPLDFLPGGVKWPTHFISTDSGCEGFNSEGPYGWVYSSPVPGASALYRLYNPVNNDHLTSFSSAEGAEFGYHTDLGLGYAM